MSFERSLPGTGKGIAKSAIKTVTANRNPNRQIIKGLSPEEEAKEKEEKDSDLRAKFEETVAREFSTSGKSSLQLLQQSQQQSQLAQLMAQSRNNLGASPQIQAPKIPSSSGNAARSNNNSGPSQSKPESHSLKKPDLVDNRPQTNKPETKKPDISKINPLEKPGQPQNSKANQDFEQPRSLAPDKPTTPKLAQAVADDVSRINNDVIDDRKFKKLAGDAQTMSGSYTQNSDKHSLGEAGIRRLVAHSIPFEPSSFDPKNTREQNDEISNKLVSSSNQTALAKLGDGKELATHYRSLGFKSGDYSQLTAKQFKESFNDIKEAKTQREAFIAGPKTPEAMAKEDARSDKQVLVLLPEKGAAQFDMSREVQDLKKLGFTPVFAQVDHENNLKVLNNDGTRTPIKQLADSLGGFGGGVIGGHGQNSKTAAIKFGEEFKITDASNPEQIAKAEKSFLDAVDFRDDKGIKDFFQDKSIFKEGAWLAVCSCSATGSKESREDYIKSEESIAAIIKGVRPDLDVLGAFDEVYASDSKYTLDDDSKLQNPTMRRLEEPEITDDLLAQLDIADEPEVQDVDDLLDSLDIGFGDDDD